MRRVFPAMILAILLSIAPWSRSTHAADDPDGFEAAFSACRSCVKRSKWKSAVEAYGALLTKYAGDPRPIQRLRIIEDDLKLCHFSIQFKKRNTAELLGRSVVEFRRGSNKLVVNYRSGPEGPRWRVIGDHAWLLDLEFEKDLVVSVTSRGVRLLEEKPVAGLAVLVFYDPDDETGYFANFGVDYSNRTHRWSADATFARIDKGKRTTLRTRKGAGSDRVKSFVVSRDRKGLAWLGKEIEDKKHKRGCVAVVGVRPEEISIRGKLTKECVNDLRADYESQAFLDWVSACWLRSKFLPKWMLTEIENRSKTCPALLPPDAEEESRERLGRLVMEALFGDDEKAAELKKEANLLDGKTRDYAKCAVAVAEGEWESAEKRLARVGEFAPAVALHGLLRMIRGQEDEARAELEKALAKEPASMLACYGLVQMAIGDGDLERARDLLDAAERAGIRSRRLTEMCELVYRTLAGPLWAKTYERKTARFIVKTNHGEKTSRRVAYALETAADSYAKFFPRPKGKTVKSKVYVFATEGGYHRYAGDLKVNLTGSAGAYDRRTRELVLFVPDQNAGFVHTVRHEGFHQFIHAALPKIPIWFNEGCAEYFAAGEKARFSGKITPGAPHLPALRTLRTAFARKTKLTPVKDLFVMNQRRFMAKAGLHYAQAWALVHYLRESGVDGMKKVFDDYVKVLRKGTSAEEAYAAVLAPVQARIERLYPVYVKSLIVSRLDR